MRVLISRNAAQRFYSSLSNPDFEQQVFFEMLKKIQGQWVDVDTRVLFRTRFKILPIKGVSTDEVLIGDGLVDAVENDLRTHPQDMKAEFFFFADERYEDHKAKYDLDRRFRTMFDCYEYIRGICGVSFKEFRKNLEIRA